ncbi:MAG: hypothetical protein H6727_01235 [Myxococcales bacterium]|nr:hypothetical protein [Myxococcales bacterium]
MIQRRRWRGLLYALILIGSWCGWGGQVAADGGATSRPHAQANEGSLREVRVYVPYHRLGQVMNEEGVFLSRQQYQTLMRVLQRWQRARTRRVPVSAVLTNADYRVRLQGDQVLLEADLSLRVLRSKDWVRVPLPFRGLPLWTAHLDGKPALLFSSKRRGGEPHLLVQGEGVHKLHLVFQGQATRQGGWREAKISIPPTPQTQLRLEVQGKGLQVQVNGEAANLKQKGDLSLASLQLGPQQQLSLRWFPRQQQSTGRRTMLSAQVYLDCVLSAGSLRMRADIALRILRGSQEKTVVRLPKGHRLLAVEAGSRLLRWRIRKHAGEQSLELLWRKALKGTHSVRLEFEQIWPTTPSQVQIPQVQVEGTSWQHGGVALRTDGALQIKVPSQEGVSQIDPEEYARINQTSAPQQAFSYLSVGYKLVVSLEKVQPRLRGRVSHQLQLDEEQAMLLTTAAFQIERAGVFRLRFRIPQKWKLLQVNCPSMEDHFLEGKETLVVTLKDKIGGPVQIRQVSSRQLWYTLKQLMGWDLLQQMGTSQRLLRERLTSPKARRELQKLFGRVRYRSSLVHRCQVRMQRKHKLADSLEIPLIEPLGLESERGEVGILMPRHLDLETEGLKGLMSVEDIDEVAGLGHGGRYPLRQAFRYVGRPASGKLKLRRKTTAIEAQAWLPVQLREDGYRMEGILRYQVRFAGTKQLQFAVSNEVAKRLQITTTVREIRKEQKKDKTIYTLLLDRRVPRDGHFLVYFTYAFPFKKALKIGAMRDLMIPSFTIPGALRQEVFWGLKKEESLSLQEAASKGITRVDASEIPSFASQANVSRVMRSREKEPPALKVYLRRHRYAQVLSAVVPVMHLEAVINMEGEVQVLAMAQIRNRGRQFLKVRLPKGAEVLSLRVAGRDRYRLELDAKDELLVDLVQRNNGQVFPLILRYRHVLPNKTRMDQWTGTLKYKGLTLVDTPVLRSTLRLYLPKQPTYVAYDTSMWHRLNARGMWQILREALWAPVRNGGFYKSLRGEYSSLVSYAGELSTQFPRRSESKSFVARSGQVHVKVSFRSPWLQWAMELGVFLVAFVLLMLLGRPLQTGIQRLRLATFSFLVLLFGTSLLPTAWVDLLYSATMAVSLLAVGWLGLAIMQTVKGRWETLAEQETIPVITNPTPVRRGSAPEDIDDLADVLDAYEPGSSKPSPVAPPTPPAKEGAQEAEEALKEEDEIEEAEEETKPKTAKGEKQAKSSAKKKSPKKED